MPEQFDDAARHGMAEPRGWQRAPDLSPIAALSSVFDHRPAREVIQAAEPLLRAGDFCDQAALLMMMAWVEAGPRGPRIATMTISHVIVARAMCRAWEEQRSADGAPRRGPLASWQERRTRSAALSAWYAGMPDAIAGDPWPFGAICECYERYRLVCLGGRP